MATREEVLYETLLDLHKAYDTLDRDRCLEILITYGVGHQAKHLLWRYWRRITMVAQSGDTSGNTSRVVTG